MADFWSPCRKAQKAVSKGRNLSDFLDFRGVTADYIERFFYYPAGACKGFLPPLLPIHLYRDNKGQLWIHKSRVKITAAKETCTSNVPLLAPAVAILDKYRGWNPDNPDGPCLPVPSNQKMNEYLKEIATLCRINKRLTVHVARHSYIFLFTRNKKLTRNKLLDR